MLENWVKYHKIGCNLVDGLRLDWKTIVNMVMNSGVP